jgi:adenylate kinase
VTAVRLVLLGPPGAGKGTQADRLAVHFSVPHIATGDLFRANLAQNTPLGQEAKRYMEAGVLVPDSVTEAMVDQRLDEPDAAAGFVLDGFPRNVAQAAALERMLARRGLAVSQAVAIDVPEAVLLERLTGRRVCPQCQATYHVTFNPPRTPGICDRCGAALVQRRDDSEETVRTRLRVYHEETAPVAAFYEHRRLLASVSGLGSVEDVTARILEVFGD